MAFVRDERYGFRLYGTVNKTPTKLAIEQGTSSINRTRN